MHLTQEMKRSRRISFVFLLLCFFSLASLAEAEQVVLHFDSDKTQIRWKVRENLRVIHGTFAFKGGEVALNSSAGSAQGELLVDTDSLQSGNQARDTRLKREVLETGKYPQAFFHATHISGTLKEGAGQQITVGGLFNIHGNDHPFTINVNVTRKGNQADLTTQFKVPYAAWGMKRPGGILWGFNKEVEIEISSHASIEEIP